MNSNLLSSLFSNSSLMNTSPQFNLISPKDVQTENQNKVLNQNENSKIKSYYYQEDKNLKYRQSMEDAGICQPNFINNYEQSLFCIFDGHGGIEVVKFIKNRLPELLKEQITNNTNSTLEDIFKKCFSQIDEELIYYDSDYTGSTATLVYIIKDELYCANVGDSRAFLITKNGAEMISVDHKCTESSESERIIKSGGIVKKGRVNGQLILSRSIGDLNSKKYGVICEPSISKQKIINNNTKFCIIASDGLWDVIDKDLLFQISQKFSQAENLAKELVSIALEKGSQDNISCIVISFER